MNEPRDLVPVAPLLITVLAVAGITSVIWSVFWHHRHTELRDSLAVQTERHENAQAARERLLDQYLGAEQTRLQQERDIRVLQQQLDKTRQQLATFESANWPSRYRDLERQNYELSERIEEQQLRHSITHDNITAERQELQTRYDDLEKAYITLELEHDALRNDYARARQSAAHEQIERRVARDEAEQEQHALFSFQQTLERDLIQQEISSSQLQSRLKQALKQQLYLQANLKDSEQRLRQLRKNERQLTAEQQAAHSTQPATATPPPVQKLTQETAARPAAAADTDGGFRLARLRSLKAAIADASSRDRKLIILTVLPTIPGGVRGAELADLITGMEGLDIVELIESSHSHIQRPLDSNSYERIMQQLADGSSRSRVAAALQ